MTTLRNMLGIAFVAMSLLTGFAVSTAHAEVCPFGPDACEVQKDAP
jgi:hypothetical protein